MDGKFGKALDFANNANKGSNDLSGMWVQAPGFTMGGGPMAVSVWVNYDAFRNWSRIIDFAKGANNENLILSNRGSGSEVHWGIRRGGSERSVRQGSFWQTNKWLHVVATYDSDNKLRLYKNGALIKTATGHAPVSTLRGDQRIGRSHWNDSYLDAQMDELRVYSTGLSQADVNAIYGGGNGETPVTAPVISSAGTASATVGQDFLYVISTDTPNVLFGAYNLPPGLTVSGAKISGKPLVGGTYTVTLTASDSAVTGTKDLTITIPASPALVKALPATNVLASTVRLNGEVVETGGDDPAITLYFGATDANEDVDGWNLSKDLGTMSKETFNVDLDSLFLDKVYYYRFKSTNSAGDSWSTAQSFRTLDKAIKPILGTDVSATDITGSRVTLNGSLVSAGGADTEVKIHWGDEDLGNTATGWDYTISLGNLVPGKFSWDISENFAPPKVFHARFEAINSAGSAWSTALHFAASASKSTALTSEAIPDLALWLDASDIDADSIPDGFVENKRLYAWNDKSGNGYHASNYRGDPRYRSSGLNNKPVINFDGGDSFWTTQKFNSILNQGYTIFTIARYTGGANNRVFSTRDGRNWLLDSMVIQYAVGIQMDGFTPKVVLTLVGTCISVTWVHRASVTPKQISG